MPILRALRTPLLHIFRFAVVVALLGLVTGIGQRHLKARGNASGILARRALGGMSWTRSLETRMQVGRAICHT
jgi:hypothetical protein